MQCNLVRGAFYLYPVEPSETVGKKCFFPAEWLYQVEPSKTVGKNWLFPQNGYTQLESLGATASFGAAKEPKGDFTCEDHNGLLQSASAMKRCCSPSPPIQRHLTCLSMLLPEDDCSDTFIACMCL